jgi:hypothetical protein
MGADKEEFRVKKKMERGWARKGRTFGADKEGIWGKRKMEHGSVRMEGMNADKD